MLHPRKPHLPVVFLLTLALSVGALAFGRDARSQENDSAAAKRVVTFSRLAIKPGSLSFKRLTFPAGPASETRSFVITNSGKGTTNLDVVVGNVTGRDAGAFSVISGGGTLAPLAPDASATVTVQFQPLKDGASVGGIPHYLRCHPRSQSA